MEEGAAGLVRALVVLDLPLSLIGIAVGIFTVGRETVRLRTSSPIDLGLVERIAVGLCAGVAMLGFLGTIETLLLKRPDFPPLAILFAASVILSALPAILWKSRWRGAAEGAATVFIATAAILSGFTIGFMFVPLVALMIWVCFLRVFRGRRPSSSEQPTRVDSVP